MFLHTPIDPSTRQTQVRTHLEFLHARHCVALRVEIVRVEGLHGCKHSMVLLIHELPVCASGVPGVEAVVADNGKGFVGQG